MSILPSDLFPPCLSSFPSVVLHLIFLLPYYIMVAEALIVLQCAIRTRSCCVCRQIAPKPTNYHPGSTPGVYFNTSCRNTRKSGQFVAGVERCQRKACTNILRWSSIWMSFCTNSAHWENIITVWKRNPHREAGNFEQKRRHRKYTCVSRDRHAVTWSPTREVVRTPQCVTDRTDTVSSSYWCGYGKVNYAVPWHQLWYRS